MGKCVLYPFQADGVARMKELDLCCLLADSMGLGKTIQALKVLEDMPQVRPAVIVTPAHLKLGWEEQAQRLFSIRMDVLSGKGPKGKGVPWFISPSIVCVNYDVLADWLPWIMDIKPKIVIADEAQQVRNPTAKRTRALKELVRSVKHFIAISATPLVNRPIELWSVLNMLDPKEFSNYNAFGIRYGRGRRTPWGWDFRGASNLKELNKRLAKLMIRRLKQDVLKDLPPKTRTMVPLKLARMKEYEAAKHDLIAWLKQNYGPHVANRATKVEAISKVAHLRRLVAELKMPQVVDWVEDFIDDEKLLVGAVHRAASASLHDSFKSKSVKVTGETSQPDRQAAFKAFNKNSKCRLFVGNIQAAGTGWSASACSNVAFIEYPWAPGEVVQFEDRAHGLFRGQEGLPTNSWWLVANGTIETTMCAMLAEKAKNLDAVMDGKTVDRLDVFDDVAMTLMRSK